jgi:hypothetical protein
VNKGIGCASCHGRVDEMPLMYQQNSLQMEWCLNCHRNPAVNLRPVSEIYNMAWNGPSSDKPVWCAETTKNGSANGGFAADGTRTPTAQAVSCTTKDPAGSNPHVAFAQSFEQGPAAMSQSQSGTMGSPNANEGANQTVSDIPPASMPLPVSYKKFTSQIEMGKYLTGQYHIRGANELSSCEVCHR